MIRRAATAALLPLVLAAGALRAQSPAGAPVRADTAALRTSLNALADAHHGIVGYLVRDLETGATIARRGDETFPTASLIKVPILVTVFDLVEKGMLSLDDRLTVLKIDKVPGAGTLQFMHDGIEITVRDAAWLMTTISDNTATDHLISRIGRERVEGFMARVTDRPRLNQPLLSTRELFALKIGNAPWLMDEYTESDEQARRELLRPGGRLFRAQVEPFSALLWKKPIAVTTIEWFASCHDLCRAMAMLRHIEQRPGMAQVGSILRKNPGIHYDPKVWKSVGFKGGSEPGVMTLTLLLERTDGRWFVLSAGWTNETELLEEQRLVEMVTKGMEMLADLE